MNLVILGGTFNPPHNGHIAMADLVRRSCGYDNVVLIPSFQPAHKIIDGDVTPEQRLYMTQLAAEEIDRALVSDCEIKRQGVSYTLDTIRFLKKKYSLSEKPGLVIGDDLIPGFHKWHQVDQLVKEADIIVLHRGEETEMNFPYPHRYLSNPQIPLSSSDIREKVLKGLSLEGDLPPSIERYIREQGLYRG